jgi:hypothetical protein
LGITKPQWKIWITLLCVSEVESFHGRKDSYCGLLGTIYMVVEEYLLLGYDAV